ncbi:MAG: hypothetical protein HOW73_41040 [Polyangiaceae bacterium]|nr:hypothetical protein [Polyangiaceae bacterium]
MTTLQALVCGRSLSVLSVSGPDDLRTAFLGAIQALSAEDERLALSLLPTAGSTAAELFGSWARSVESSLIPALSDTPRAAWMRAWVNARPPIGNTFIAGEDPAQAFAEWIEGFGRRLEGFGAQVVLLLSDGGSIPVDLRDEAARAARMLDSARVRLITLESGSRPLFADDVALAELDCDGWHLPLPGSGTRQPRRKDRSAEQLRWLVEIAVMMSWNNEHTSALAAVGRASENAASPLDRAYVCLHEGNILARAGQLREAMASYHRGLQYLTDECARVPPLLTAGLILGVAACGVAVKELASETLCEIAGDLSRGEGNLVGVVRAEAARGAALFRTGRVAEAQRSWRWALRAAIGLQERSVRDERV